MRSRLRRPSFPLRLVSVLFPGSDGFLVRHCHPAMRVASESWHLGDAKRMRGEPARSRVLGARTTTAPRQRPNPTVGCQPAALSEGTMSERALVRIPVRGSPMGRNKCGRPLKPSSIIRRGLLASPVLPSAGSTTMYHYIVVGERLEERNACRRSGGTGRGSLGFFSVGLQRRAVPRRKRWRLTRRCSRRSA